MMLAFFTVDPDKDFDASATECKSTKPRSSKLYARYIARLDPFWRDMLNLAGHSANYTSANGKVIELKIKLGMPSDDEDR